MRVKDYSITGRKHSNPIVEDSLRRVRTRRDTADNAIGGIFGECQPIISRPSCWLQGLNARCFFGD